MSDHASVKVREDAGPGVVVVAPSGEVDMSCSPELRASLREVQGRKPHTLVVDLEDVTYMDSSGLATLVEAMRTAKGDGTRMVLCAMNERVRAIFEIARLDQFFAIAESVEAAVSG